MRKFYIYGIYDKEEPEHILYVGQHVYNNINDSYMGSGKNLLAYYKMFGKNNFSKIILESEIDIENIGNKEKEYIQYYKNKGQAELNILNGSNTTLSPRFLMLPSEDIEDYKKRRKKEYNKLNSEKIKIQNKIRIERWMLKNKEHKKNKDKEYYYLHKEKINETGKKFRKNHKEEVSEYSKKYYNSHKEELKKYKAEIYKITKFLKKCPALWNYYIGLKSNIKKTFFREEIKQALEIL